MDLVETVKGVCIGLNWHSIMFTGELCFETVEFRHLIRGGVLYLFSHRQNDRILNQNLFLPAGTEL